VTFATLLEVYVILAIAFHGASYCTSFGFPLCVHPSRMTLVNGERVSRGFKQFDVENGESMYSRLNTLVNEINSLGVN
jgi:hypothetical protein